MERNRASSLNQGFTLLEVLIAIAIMVTALAAIFAIEGSSINASDKAKRMNVVAMLAKNKMIETENDIEGKDFEEIEKEKSGNFEAPFEDYSWRRSVKEIKFPVLGGGGAAGGDDNAQVTELITRLSANYLSKALREVTVSIVWHRGSKEQSFSVSTYWVDLNHAFELSE